MQDSTIIYLFVLAFIILSIIVYKIITYIENKCCSDDTYLSAEQMVQYYNFELELQRRINAQATILGKNLTSSEVSSELIEQV